MLFEFASLLSVKEFDRFFSLLKENDYIFTDEVFNKIFKSPKFTSRMLHEFKKLGMNIPDMFSFVSLFKKHYRNWWDTFFE
jgi:hypothetical protein